jgi:hypothetical protein
MSNRRLRVTIDSWDATRQRCANHVETEAALFVWLCEMHYCSGALSHDILTVTWC